MWSHILRDQLRVTPAEFWDCVNQKTKPDRGGLPVSNSNALPLHVLNELVVRLGMVPSEAAAVPLPEALEKLNQYWLEEAEKSATDGAR